MARDDFPLAVRDTLAKRVGFKCSNPPCGKHTSGPREDDAAKAVNIGVASHITAASPDGPRYDPSLTPEERRSAGNGIWLCQNCGKLVDNDVGRFTVEELKAWKLVSESLQRRLVESNEPAVGPSVNYGRLERLMPTLLVEMRKDMKDHPGTREIILFQKDAIYGHDGTPLFMYYFEEHPNLRNDFRMLENCGLVRDITFNSVPRFQMTEEFATYLEASDAQI